MLSRVALVIVLMILSEAAFRSQEAIVPFKIQVADSVLADLKERLGRTRFPGEIAKSDWDYGTNLTYLKELVTYWRDRFDWRAAERRLNQFDQFTTNIDGLDIHFIHQRSKNPNAMPIAVTHGWPGSVVEFTKIIGPLTDPAAHGGNADDSFHVVAISLPGFGFSGKPTERGYSPERIAGIIAKLMARLGYTRYGLQGGDWGSSISRFVALNDASHVAGLHLNFCLAGPPAGAKDPNEGVTPAELERTRARQAFFDTERGLLPGAEHEAANDRLRVGRFTRGARGVDRREVPVVERQRRQRGEEVHEGRTADQHHALLGHPVGDVVCAHLLREPACETAAGARAGADGVRRVPQGDQHRAAPLGGGAVQPHALDRDATGRAFRRDGRAQSTGGRHARVLQDAAVSAC